MAACRDEDSENEMEETGAAARKFGMTTSNKGPEKKRTDHTLSMMLQRQAQVAKAKKEGSLGGASGAGVKRKPEKTVEVGLDDLLADFDAPAPVPKKKQSTLPRAAPRVRGCVICVLHTSCAEFICELSSCVFVPCVCSPRGTASAVGQNRFRLQLVAR